MEKINKSLTNRFISTIVGIAFFFANLSSAYSDPQHISGNSLRLPVGEKSTYQRMAETITRRSVVKGIGAAALLVAFSSVLSYTPSGEEYYMKLAETNPENTLIKFEEYKGQPFVSNVVKMAVKQLRRDRFIDEFHSYPKAFWEYMFSEVWRNTSENGTIEENQAKEILSNIASNPNQSRKKELISFLAERYPDMFLGVARKYALWQPAKWEDVEFIKRLYAKTLINDFIQGYNTVPLGPLFYAGQRIIANGRSSYIESIVSLDEANFTMDAVKSYGGAIGDILTRIAVLKYDPKDALSLINEIWNAFNEQGILNDKEAFSLLRYLSLGLIKNINDLHTERDEIRFASIQDASSPQLYILMVYGEEELYTSSFNGIFNRFISKLQNEGTSLQDFFVKQNYIKFRTLIKMSSWYDRLPDLLEGKGSSRNFKKSLLQRFIKGLEQEIDPLSEAVAVAESFNYIKEDLILEILQQTVKSEYKRVESKGDYNAKVIYGLLAGLFSDNAVVSKDWFKTMGEKYKLPDLKVLSKDVLFDSKGVNTQRYFFYDDEDGVTSFNIFLWQYRNDLNWKIEENDEYVRIVSRSGEKIEIYANRPKYNGSGQQKIELLLKENQQNALIVVHRGHSPYIGNTIKKIDSNAVFVGLGSCGGYVSVKKVLEKSRKAHILSTKGRGTAYVNDPLLKMINELIRKGQDIVWEDLWAKAKQRFRTDPDFEQYVQPDKNLGALFFQAYNDEVDKDKSIDSGSLNSTLMAGLGVAAWGRVTDKANISRRNFLLGGFISGDSGKLASGQNVGYRPGWTFAGWGAAKDAIKQRFKSTEERKEALQLVRTLARKLAENKISLRYYTLKHAISAVVEAAENIKELKLFIDLGIKLAENKKNPYYTLQFAIPAVAAVVNVKIKARQQKLKTICDKLFTLNIKLDKNKIYAPYVLQYVIRAAAKVARKNTNKLELFINLIIKYAENGIYHGSTLLEDVMPRLAEAAKTTQELEDMCDTFFNLSVLAENKGINSQSFYHIIDQSLEATGNSCEGFKEVCKDAILKMASKMKRAKPFNFIKDSQNARNQI